MLSRNATLHKFIDECGSKEIRITMHFRIRRRMMSQQALIELRRYELSQYRNGSAK